MPVKHKKEFGIYHWDTFDNETILVCEADTKEEAVELVEKKYKGRLNPTSGADQVDIVDKWGQIYGSWKVS